MYTYMTYTMHMNMYMYFEVHGSLLLFLYNSLFCFGCVHLPFPFLSPRALVSLMYTRKCKHTCINLLAEKILLTDDWRDTLSPMWEGPRKWTDSMPSRDSGERLSRLEKKPTINQSPHRYMYV